MDVTQDARDWKPILDGPLADEARRAVRDVARDVGDRREAPRRAADLALFWAYLAGVLDDEWSVARYDEACTELCASLSAHRSLALHGGLAGAAWVIAHISEGGSADDLLASVDDVLLRALQVERWKREYDLIGGLVGYGLYAIERVTSSGSPAPERVLGCVVDHLIATSEEPHEGATWYTAPELMPAWQLASSPEGYYNCGLAHGVPGVIALLGHVVALGGGARPRSLCEAALRWMHDQQLAEDPRGRYPEFRGRDQEADRPARTAWCYGDPGVAIACWSAALRLGRPTDEWRELARCSAIRDPELCGVVDPCLCHGAAGLAHIYNRAYQACGDPVFLDAARAWFRRTLDMRRPEGLGGFASPSQVPDTWRTSTGLLDGATGVALALLAALEPVEPRWDRLLLCDLPPDRNS